jgi:hypothetical protein
MRETKSRANQLAVRGASGALENACQVATGSFLKNSERQVDIPRKVRNR